MKIPKRFWGICNTFVTLTVVKQVCIHRTMMPTASKSRKEILMKKILAFALLLCMILTFAACADNEGTAPESTAPESTAPESTAPESTTPEGTESEITMQKIYAASQTEALFKNHQSLSVRLEMDGKIFYERYLTKDYIYSYFPAEGSDWMEFITDDAYYYDADDALVRYLPITPDGVSDFTSLRAECYVATFFGEDILEETIASVTKKDGQITVKTFLGQEALAKYEAISGRSEYVLDAETLEIISHTSDITYDDGTSFCVATKVTYDAEASETVKTLLSYVNQTEDLRNITVISNPGPANEKTESVQAAKGLIIGFRYDEDAEENFVLYTDAACTELYDPYVNTDSDLTIYVKWDK